MFKLFAKYLDENEFAKIILKHDGIIYGNVVRELISNKLNTKKDSVLKAFIPEKYKDIIERNLYEHIYKIINYNEIIKTSYMTEYILRKNKYNVTSLIIFYLPEIYMNNTLVIIKKLINILLL